MKKYLIAISAASVLLAAFTLTVILICYMQQETITTPLVFAYGILSVAIVFITQITYCYIKR